MDKMNIYDFIYNRYKIPIYFNNLKKKKHIINEDIHFPNIYEIDDKNLYIKIEHIEGKSPKKSNFRSYMGQFNDINKNLVKNNLTVMDVSPVNTIIDKNKVLKIIDIDMSSNSTFSSVKYFFNNIFLKTIKSKNFEETKYLNSKFSNIYFSDNDEYSGCHTKVHS